MSKIYENMLLIFNHIGNVVDLVWLQNGKLFNPSNFRTTNIKYFFTLKKIAHV